VVFHERDARYEHRQSGNVISAFGHLPGFLHNSSVSPLAMVPHDTLGRGRPPGCDDRQAAGATTDSGTRQRQACQTITAVQEISRRLKKA
jgi:hypothetical protein